MMLEIRITDITAKASSKYLYKCLAPIPFKKYRRRLEYLKVAIPRGLCKKILLLDSDVVGQIEYAPPRVFRIPHIR